MVYFSLDAFRNDYNVSSPLHTADISTSRPKNTYISSFFYQNLPKKYYDTELSLCQIETKRASNDDDDNEAAHANAWEIIRKEHAWACTLLWYVWLLITFARQAKNDFGIYLGSIITIKLNTEKKSEEKFVWRRMGKNWRSLRFCFGELALSMRETWNMQKQHTKWIYPSHGHTQRHFSNKMTHNRICYNFRPNENSMHKKAPISCRFFVFFSFWCNWLSLPLYLWWWSSVVDGNYKLCA